jgi:hypothetical protein
MTPEAKTKHRINGVLKPYVIDGDMWVHMAVLTGYGTPSLDYVGFVCGRGFAIEAKRDGGRPTVRQEQTIIKMERAGAKVFLINSDESLEELKRWLLRVVENHRKI